MGFFKSAFNFVKKTVKVVVDPIIDIGTSVVKAVISPFTGAFDLPDLNIDTGVASDTIKAATTVDFNGANRTIPVLYGNRIEVATIPVFIGTHGDNSADTSKQYLYMAAIISQGFHGTNQDTAVDPIMGSLLSRMTIDGKPVNLNGLTNTANDNYSAGYDGSTALGVTDNDGGIFASGLGGTQPTQHTITRGTFANRLKIQYFDGSSDQPVSSLLREHPDWNDDQNTLSGMHYVALRFELKSADEVVSGSPGSDGDGTYGNPYGNVPAVVVTTSGRSTPNLMSGKASDPGYEEKFQTSYTDNDLTRYMSYHKPLKTPIFNGDLDAFDGTVNDRAREARLSVNSDTEIQVRRFFNFQSEKFNTGATQPFNVHNKLQELGWTNDYVFFFPGLVTGSYNSDSTSVTTTFGGSSDGTDGMIWLKNVGGSHYKIISKIPRDLTTTVTSSEVTLFGYDGDITSTINSETPTNSNLSAGTAVYRFYAEDLELNKIRSYIEDDGYTAQLRIRNRDTNLNSVYDIQGIDYTSGNTHIDLSIVNEDSSAVATDFYTTVPLDSEIYVEIKTGSTNTNKLPASWDISFASGYLTDGLTHQGYRCDTNVVEYILDYLLNPNYGCGLSLDQIDQKSFQTAAIAMDRIPEYYDFDNTIFYMGSGVDFQSANTAEYMSGENATDGTVNGYIIRTANNGYDRQFIIDTGKTFLDNINQMLSSIGAYMVFVDGKYKIILENAGDPEDSERIPPVTALPITLITDDNIIESAGISTPSINDRFNQIKIDYTDITNNSQPASILTPDPLEDSTDIRTNYLNEDGGKILEGAFSQPGIFDPVTAKKYGTLLLKKSRGQPRLTIQINPVGMNIIPGDFIRIDSDSLGVNDVYRVTDVSVNPDNTIALNAIKHVPEFYDTTDTGQVFEAQRPVLE